jgi:uncharacterized lipoprotein YehR (DUF1307 family)
MKIFVKIISILAVLVMCISAAACGDKGDETSMNNPVVNPESGVKVGDKITLGKYEQNGDMASKEDIVWTVVKVEEGRALLLSDYCLTYSGFHGKNEAFTWVDSDMRYNLNNDFFGAAFSDEEKALIDEVVIENGENYVFALGGDIDSKDRVFLLSMEEAKELLDEATVTGKPTQFVKNTSKMTHGSASCNWWLRTSGSTDKKAVVVGYNDVINIPGLRGDIAEAGVRPALWYKTEINAEKVAAPLTLAELASA